MVLAVFGPALAPFADGLGAHAEALGQHAGGLGRAGDFLADGRGGAGLGMNGVHQILLRRGARRRRPSKRQAYSPIAQRTRSQQRSATKQRPRSSTLFASGTGATTRIASIPRS